MILIQDRKMIVDTIKKRLYDDVLEFRDDERLFKDIKNLIVTLIVDSQNDTPHSAVRRSCLANFKSFFIDKFDGLDKNRLNIAYQRVVNQSL